MTETAMTTAATEHTGENRHGEQAPIRILFVCHGNICRSPMAEFVFRHLAALRGQPDAFQVSSAATSAEELGNPVHPGTREKLRSRNIPLGDHRAVRLTRADGAHWDYLIGMDGRNVADMRRILGGEAAGKIFRLLDFTESPRDIADPWYTGDFDATFEDILEGCQMLLERLLHGGGVTRAYEKDTL